MAKLFNISLAGQYPPLNNRINHFDRLLAQKIGDGGVITTATGNPVSIVTNKAQNAISTILSFAPKQSGSGDPSPDNIRPIEGWTEANLHVNEDTITISLGGTYYGFTVDLENGTLTITHTISIIDENMDGGVANIGGLWFVNNLALIEYGAGLSISDSFVYTGRSYANTSEFKANTVIGDMGGCSISGNRFRVFFRDDRFANNDELKAYLAENPVYVVQGLTEPQTIPITPQTVALLAGNNTLWTDGDEISITYKAKR